ncbi:GumC family protein [Tunturiibacter gelidiferens]|uniref:GumC family protein n=1 Tax=Tunturiibacter gelidiferens TaxID=3069689 RepID=UPI003D9B854B
MLGHRALTVQDYITILKRRWWMIAIPAVIFPIVGYGLTFLVQPQYVSQTLVLVEQQKVPESYVKAVVTEDLSGRLASMKEQILSRSRLQPIIERFNLFASGKLSMDERIDLTRKNIGITPIQSEIARTNGLPGFFISFKANDARTAQLVCGEIQSLFVSENLSDRAASAAGTTEFLKSQLADAKAKLDEQDARLAKFQQTYMGKLPAAEASNMNMLTSLNTQLEAATQALARMEQDKSYAESILSMQQAQQPQTTERGGGPVAPQAQQLELQQLQSQLADLKARYTDDYPDVVSTQRKINELERKLAQAPQPRLRRLPLRNRPTPSACSRRVPRFVRWNKASRRRSATRRQFRPSFAPIRIASPPAPPWRRSTRASHATRARRRPSTTIYSTS